ncbi:MAG: transporter substrate-binding domain-containing protein [Deltaproteobacteria bacterium]|jgi:signal transduction histidine kinase|nr:transporter substrate-binding domain-containing protein [Deltaproteobacteria bacterium]
MTSVTRNSKYNTAIRFFFLAAACMILLPLYTYGEAKNGEQPHVSDVSVHKKVLKTIIVDNYSPYTFVNQSGDPDGFSVDLIKAVAEEMGLALKIHVDTWAPARNALKDGNIDVLPMMAYSKERDEQFDFSVPHTIAYDAFFTRKDAGRIRSLDDLRGKKIIVMKGDQAHDYLLSTGTIGPEQLIFINSLPDALRLLSSGKGDAALMPKLVGLIVVKNLKLSNLELSPIVIEAYNRPFSFAVTEGNQPLLERLSQGLSIVKTSDQYSNIYKKWFGALEPPGLSLKTVLKYIGVIILVFMVIGTVLLLWSFSLRRQVAFRTRSLEEEISERKQAEEALRESEGKYRELSVELEQRVQKRTDQLEGANKELESFAYSVSHDLRAPLRGIDGFSQVLLEDYEEKLDEEGKDYLGRIRSGTQRMGHLIDDLLRLSRLTRSEMRHEPVNLSTLAENVSVALRESGSERKVTFDITPNLKAHGDRYLLGVAIENLFSNAWKFSSGHDQARIEFGVEKLEGKNAYFIRDDGVGFDMAYADKLFGAFQRLHGTTEFPGSGIGLATVQRIIHRHGGQIWAESKVGEGATFYFTLSQ